MNKLILIIALSQALGGTLHAQGSSGLGSELKSSWSGAQVITRPCMGVDNECTGPQAERALIMAPRLCLDMFQDDIVKSVDRPELTGPEVRRIALNYFFECLAM